MKVARDERKGEGAEIDFETVPSPTEVRSLVAKLDELAEAKREWIGKRAYVRTAIGTGMRASELRGLAWDHVDLKHGVIKVRQRADENGTIGPPKSIQTNAISNSDEAIRTADWNRSLTTTPTYPERIT